MYSVIIQPVSQQGITSNQGQTLYFSHIEKIIQPRNKNTQSIRIDEGCRSSKREVLGRDRELKSRIMIGRFEERRKGY